MLRAARRLGAKRATSSSRPASSARTRCRRNTGSDATAYVDLVVDEMLPALAAEGLADAVDGFCETIAFTPAEIARVFDAARRARPAGEAARRAALQPRRRGAGGLLRRAVRRSSRISRRGRRRGDGARRGRSPCCCPAPSTPCARRQAPPVEALRRHGVPIAVATDCNPGTSPLTSLLTALNMAATLFRLTVEECLLGVTRNAARALGLEAEIGYARSRQGRAFRDLGHRAAGRTRLSHRLQSAASPGLERSNDARRRGLAGGMAANLARRRGCARSRLRERGRRAARRRCSASSRAGEPVYGVNTGFGKLSTRPHRRRRSHEAATQYRAVPCGGRRRAGVASRRPG